MKLTACFCGALVCCFLVRAKASFAQSAGAGQVRSFDADPGWEGFRNHLLPEDPPIVKQSFGFSNTNHAGGDEPGEIGGTISRSATRAFYAMPIPECSLDEPLTASGRFAVTSASASSGVMVGWFHHAASRGWRTPNSLAFRIDGNGAKYWLFYEYGTRHLRTGGGGAFEGERYQTTKTKPFPADGTVHRWALDYDPRGNGGYGLVTFTVDGQTHKPVPVQPEHRQDGAVFDRFGIWNVQIGGEPMDVYLDVVVVNGRRFDFSKDPNWEGVGNQAEFRERVIRPLHDFGYRATNHFGGERGEIGGVIFRDEKPAYYADRVGPLTLENELAATGRIVLNQASSDSGVCLGWFDSAEKRGKTTPEHEQRQKNYLGIIIEGPSRIGHYFRGAYSTAAGSGQTASPELPAKSHPPVIAPDGRVREFSLHYSPNGGNGDGRLRVTFEDHTHVIDLRPEDRRSGARFDRFGLFNLQSGGHHVEIYLDDLSYTSAADQ